MSKCRALWSTNSFKLDLHFCPPYVNFAFHFIARLRRRRSANGTQPHFVKWWTVGRSNNVAYKSWGRPSRKKWGPKDFYICSVFRRLRHLMANICWTKHDTDNQATALESAKGLLRCCKISWTLVHKRLQTGPEVLPTLTNLFCHSPLHTLYAALTWRPAVAQDETALGSSAAKIWSPKRC